MRNARTVRSARCHHLLGRALDASNVPMVLVDVGRPGEPVVMCNPAFATFTGYEEREIIGRNCRFLQGEDRDQPGRRQLAEALREEREARVVLRNYRRDGGMFFNEISIAPLRDASGRLTHYIGVMHDISEQVAIETQLRELASTDPLTGLYNRRRFESLASQEIHRSHRYARPMVLMMLDLDHFKQVNDAHGHACGDAVLVTVADRLAAGLRGHDICVWVGGEEFAALLPETPVAAGLEVAERLRRSVAEGVTPWDGHEIRVTVSIGLTQLADWDDGPAGLLERADAALYASKQRGRDRVTVA